MYQKHNKAFATQLRKDMTPWERKLWYCFLRDYPVRFQRQKCIGQYIADFIVLRQNWSYNQTAVDVMTRKHEKKDNDRTEVLEGYGLRVIRFCNTEIDKNFYAVCSVIDNEIKKLTHL